MTTECRVSTTHRVLRTMLIAAACTVASACALPPEDWSEVRQTPQARAEPATFRHMVRFQPNSAHISGPERHRLGSFLSQVRPEDADAIVLAVEPLHAPAGDKKPILLRLRQREIMSAFQQAGAAAETISIDAAQAPADSVVATVRTHVVVLPGCPDWSTDPRRGGNNQPSSNWGCATAVNFGIMIANPRDMIRGRGLSPANGERLARSIERYRNDKTTPLTNENATSVSPQPTSSPEGG
jgi:pilus assembly protein CpaD